MNGWARQATKAMGWANGVHMHRESSATDEEVTALSQEGTRGFRVILYQVQGKETDKKGGGEDGASQEGGGRKPRMRTPAQQ